MRILLLATLCLVGCGGISERPEKQDPKDDPVLEEFDLSSQNGKTISEVSVYLMKNRKHSNQSLDQMSESLDQKWNINCEKICSITKKE